MWMHLAHILAHSRSITIYIISMLLISEIPQVWVFWVRFLRFHERTQFPPAAQGMPRIVGKQQNLVERLGTGCPSSLQKEPILPTTPCFGFPALRIVRETFLCFKPSNLWWFITAALGKKYIHCRHFSRHSQTHGETFWRISAEMVGSETHKYCPLSLWILCSLPG